jgi:long-chain acyl-CoA synthetase
MPAQVPFHTIPELFTNLVDAYRGQNRTVMRYKDRDTKQWTPITWETLEERVQAFAGYLHQQGVRAGDRVAILSENRPEWAITDLATQLIGGINVSIYTSLPEQKVGYIVRDSGARILVVSVPIQRKKAEAIFDECRNLEDIIVMSDLPDGAPSHLTHWDDAMDAGAGHWAAHEETLAPLSDAVSPDDTSALIYTSGTTGQPKGVVLTHENFCSNARAALNRVPFGPDDHHLSFLPLCHSFERTAGYTAVLAAGATISYAESIEAVSQNLMEESPTVMISVPRLFEKVYNIVTKQASEGSAVKQKVFEWAVRTGKKVVKARRDGSPGPLLTVQQQLAHRLVFSKLHDKLGGNLNFAVSGGAALPKDIGLFFQAAGIKIIEGYGLTETAPVLSANPMDAPRYGTVGHVLPGITVAIQRLSDNEIIGAQRGDDYPSDLTTDEGEIIAKGPNIMREYWKRPEDTRAAFDPDDWYHTGDIGRFDDGYLMVTDRLKHMIVSRGGKNIYPGPIEDEFKTKPWFDQVVVIGEGRPFLTALVVPDFETLRMRARDHQVNESALSDEELIDNPDIQKLFRKAFREYGREAPAHEKIRDFTLLTEPFTVENGTQTPTMKLKRNVIEERYEEEIDDMYAKFER